MREIKFRAWDFENNEMIPGDALAFEEYAPICELLTQEGVMQYTGLRDSRRTEEYPEGQEIYESDIIIFFEELEFVNKLPKTAYMKVTFERGCFWGENTDWQEPLFELIDDGEIYVKGNVFENPELAEKL